MGVTRSSMKVMTRQVNQKVMPAGAVTRMPARK